MLAAPSQEEVLRSISENVDATVDPTRVLAFLVLAAAVVLLLVVLGHYRKRQVVPKPLNHHGTLLKEVKKASGLRPAELKRLKALAERAGPGDQPLESPLTLLLCPSLMKRATAETKR